MQTWTSETHPIRVDFIPPTILRLPGQLGMTFAPGKQHQGSHALWRRNVDADLQRICTHYRADVLVSLIEAQEYDFLQIPNLREQAKDWGLRVRWFPIPDFGTPASMAGLVDLVAFILAELRQGQVVVVHCRGGLGRTGLVVASCLVALGYTPDAAFAQVRQSRPGSVETEGQERFVRQFVAAWQQQQLG